MRARIVSKALGILGGGILLTGSLTGCTGAPDSLPEPVRCEEDQPCWDCETMGNLTCGPESFSDREV